MQLKLDNIGFATAYASVPIGSFNFEAMLIRRKVRRWKKAWKAAHSPELPEPISDAETTYLLGEADLAAQIRVTDFRRVFDIGYPAGDCMASTVNWVFSVKYDLPRLNFNTSPDRDFQFILHLRYRRSIFAYPHAEEAIIDTILRLGQSDGLIANLQAGMGWSDLIVEGSFSSSTHEKFRRFIISVHGIFLSIAGKEHAAFDRMLTVIGYPDKEPPVFEHGHMMFVRAVPLQYDKIAPQLKKFGDVHILDGKADFVTAQMTNRPNFLKEQRKLVGRNGRGIFQKIDTHVMYGLASNYEHVANTREMLALVSDQILAKQCRCSREAAEWYRKLALQITLLDQSLLPLGQRYSIENMLFLLGGALKDPTGCCDVRDAVLACYDGLDTILRGLDEKSKDLVLPKSIDGHGLSPLEYQVKRKAAENDALRTHQAEIVAFYPRIDEWHRFAELLLRQRTVGSFEEILGHTDRAVVYSGGVQKFLYLADRLVNEFAGKVDDKLPNFATIYDSVKTIVSRSGLGLLHIPTRNIFQLPLAVADLWHEVGSVLYNEVKRPTLVLPEDPREARELIAILSDSFGDIIVYLFGFAGDIDKFIASLAWATKETYATDHRDVAPHEVGQFLLRIYLVFEFHKLREVVKSDVGSSLVTVDGDMIFKHVVGWITELKSHWESSYAKSKTYERLKIDQEQWIHLGKSVLHKNFSLFFRDLYRPYVARRVDTPRQSVEGFESGEIQLIPPRADLNAYFGDVAYMIQAPDADRMNYFLMMATLGKSATIEYHRRRATGQN